jgi:hypothetical protein
MGRRLPSSPTSAKTSQRTAGTPAAPAAMTRDEADRLLQTEEDHLMKLTRRLYALEALRAELTTATRGKDFRVWNSVVWTMVVDMRDMHVIHLTSWARVLTGRKGLFRALQRFPIKLLRAMSPGSFGKLFPQAQGDAPSEGDFDQLVSKLLVLIEPLTVDRNSNRAHSFEVPPGSARALNLDDLRALTIELQETFNSLRRLAFGSELGYSDLNSTPVKAVAKELVETILVGPDPRRSAVRGTKPLRTFYGELHERHDKRTGSKRLFNDNP